MPDSQASRRLFGCLLVALAVVGAFVVLRLVMRVGFMAMGLAMRGLLSFGSLIALAVLVWILYRAYKKRWDL